LFHLTGKNLLLLSGFSTMKSGMLFVCSVLLVSSLLAEERDQNAARFTENAMKLRQSILFKVEPDSQRNHQLGHTDVKYPWHEGIVTTVFWIGENTSANNPVPNHSSAWDNNWACSFGGSDAPNAGDRQGFIPAKFVPRQNPFYVALPYNDVSGGRTKAEASKIIPWFNQAFVKSGQTVLQGRWVAIRRDNRICYAQWEDVGPFRSDHWQYVFGTDRPRANLNRGAGLDVSPAVRDYLTLGSTDVTDWRFVDFAEVAPGPWTLFGDNNTFVIDRRKREQNFVKRAP
jgi:hypothetical protein